jgi:hypothetical protein
VNKVSEWQTNANSVATGDTDTKCSTVPLPFAQEPNLIKPFDFSLLSNAIDEYFGNCGAIPDNVFSDEAIDEAILNSLQSLPLSEFKDEVLLPEDLNAVTIDLGKTLNFQNADLSDCSQCFYGIQSIVHQGISLDTYYKQINAIPNSTIANQGHVDGGSQSTVTGNQDLLWYR